jgi:thioesterase domain-containing protein
LADHASPGGSSLVSDHSDLLVPLRGGGEGPPLYCVHAVSGSAYAYSGLAGLLQPGQPVYGFEAPGFDNDHAPVTCLPQLADEYTAILRAHAPGLKYRLLGWSLGGLMAFEIAKRLRAAGDEVAALVLVDAPVPHVQPLPPEREILLRFINDMLGTSEEEATPPVRSLFASWPEDVDPASAFPLIEKAGILPGELDASLLADQYAVFRALLEGFNSIELTGSLDGDALHILAEISPRHGMDWRGALPGVSEIRLPGTHYSIWSGQSLARMSEIVQTALDAQ